MSANGMIYVALPHATVGLIVRDGVIVDAPPLVRRSIIGTDARAVWRRMYHRAIDLQWLPDK